MNTAIKEALDAVRLEEKRLRGERDRIDAELAKVAEVRAMMERHAGSTAPKPERKLAPAGLLDEAIIAALDRTKPKSRADIIAAIKATGYAYALTELHVTKHLIGLARERKVAKVGEGVRTKYVRAGKK